MKTFIALFLCIVMMSGVSAVAASIENDLSGKWTAVADAQGQAITIAMELKQDGEKLTGSTSSEIGNGTIEEGKVSGKVFTATLRTQLMGQAVEFKIDGTLDGDKVAGSFTNSQFGAIPYTATRNK